jgi:tetratricopeptide (TPR) repeat protein
MLQKGPLSEIIYKGSLSARGYYWRSGIEMFKDNPFTGVGLDRFAYFFKQYREIGYVNTYGYDINTSDAHNVFIQLFSTGGLFVGLSYLFFTLAVFILGIKSLQKLEDQEFKILLVAISGWLGYQSQSLISINNIGTAIWGWYFSGIIIGLSILVKKRINVADNKSVKISVKSKNLNVYPVLVSILILIPTLILSVLINRSEHAVFMNRGYSEINPAPQFSSIAIASSNTVISNPISENYYKLSAGRVLVNFSKFEEGFKAIENLINTDPSLQAALEYMASARTFDGSYTQARKYRLQIMKIDPFNAPNLLSLVEINLKLGNLSEAQGISGRLAAIFPNSEQSIKSQELLKTLQ